MNILSVNVMDIVVNVLGGIAMLLFILTAYIKNKKKILSIQCVAHFIFIISEFLTSAWSSIVQELVSIIRNLFVIYKKNTKLLNIILIIIGAVIGVMVNIIGSSDNAPWYGSLIGYLPVIANLEFTIVVTRPNVKVSSIKLAFFVSSLLWAINFFFLGIYVSSLLNLVTAITSLYTFIRIKISKVEPVEQTEE